MSGLAVMLRAAEPEGSQWIIESRLSQRYILWNPASGSAGRYLNYWLRSISGQLQITYPINFPAPLKIGATSEMFGKDKNILGFLFMFLSFKL